MQQWDGVKAFPSAGEELLFGDLETRARQYNARASVPDFDASIAEYAQLSRQADASCPAIRDLRYGMAAAERLDIFPTPLSQQPAPVFIFVHGGYWRSQTKEDASMLALHLPKAGIAVCNVEYTLLPGATLPEAVRQIRAAIAWLHRHAAQYGLDAHRFVVGGSSAGAHLAAMAAADGWTDEYGLPADSIKGLVGLSGLYDLRPLCDINVNSWLHLQPEQAWRVSPVCHLPRAGLPMVLSVGGQETDGFKAQTSAYAHIAAQGGAEIMRCDMADSNHFNLLVELTKANSPLTQAVQGLVNQLPAFAGSLDASAGRGMA